MVRVVLHGEIGQFVGTKEWSLSVKTPREALRAIEANTKKLFKYLNEENNMSSLYRVVINGDDMQSYHQLASPIGKLRSLEIMPILGGGSSGGLLTIIGAALLVVALSIVTFGGAAAAAAATEAGAAGDAAAAGGAAGVGLFSGVSSFISADSFAVTIAGLATTMGITLILAGISQMLSPSPQQPLSTPSYVFGGAVNTTQQGSPVPIGYGELLIGSVVISAGIASFPIPVTSATPPIPTGLTVPIT